LVWRDWRRLHGFLHNAYYTFLRTLIFFQNHYLRRDFLHAVIYVNERE